jgi:hypothetical protein
MPMDQPEGAPPPEPAPPEPAPPEPPPPPAPVLPEPGPKPPVPPEYRFPFKGKMDAPTVVKSRAERDAERATALKRRRGRGFLYGLLAGQILVVAIDLGGAAALHFLQDRIRVDAPIPFQALVFVGMSAGILITALLILAVLGLQGAGWFFGKKKVGFFTAVGRGLKHVLKAAWALGLTLGVVGGTAWLMIPGSEWSRTAEYFKEKGIEGRDRAKSWVTELFGPSKKDPPSAPE